MALCIVCNVSKPDIDIGSMNVRINGLMHSDGNICMECIGNNPHCHDCDIVLINSSMLVIEDESIKYHFCHNCRQDHSCARCNIQILYPEYANVFGYTYETPLCTGCYDDMIYCDDCDINIFGNDINRINGGDYCPHCIRDHMDENNNTSLPSFRTRNTNIAGGKSEAVKNPKAGEIIKSPRFFGIEFEMLAPNTARRGLIAKHAPPMWGVTTDASLPDNGLEIQTAPSSVYAGEEQVKKFLTAVRNDGATINERCGTHVHIDGSDLNEDYKKLRRAVIAFYLFDPIFLAMLPSTRRTNRYCSPLSKDKAVINRDRGFEKGFDIDALIAKQTRNSMMHEYYKTREASELTRAIHNHYNEARYYGINFHSLFSGYGTIENRYHEGTLNAEDILHWVAVNQHIIDTCRLMTDKLAVALNSISDTIIRFETYASATNMPAHLKAYCLNRINTFSN